VIQSAVSRGRRVLFVAHRKELIDQAWERLRAAGVSAGVIMADDDRRAPEHDVQVASVQTLVRRTTWPGADVVVIDECQHAASDSYGRLFTHYPDAVHLGLTATPWRVDGRGLAGLFDGSVVAATPAELIAQGHLCRWDHLVFDPPDLGHLRTVAGDYEQHGLSLECSKSAIVGDVVSKWLAQASSLKTILFAVDIDHSRALAVAFAAQGVRVETIDHHTSKPEREACLDRLRTGETRIVCNVGILGEGYDLPDLECVVLARPTQSLGLYLQQVGRVMRPAPGKQRARIRDHAGLLRRFGRIDASRDYSLQAARGTHPAPDLESLTTCPQCLAVFVGDACPSCGAIPPRVKRGAVNAVPAESETLIRSEDHPPAVETMRSKLERRDQLLKDFERKARRLGLKPGWCVHQVTKELGEVPFPASWWRSSVVGSKAEGFRWR